MAENKNKVGEAYVEYTADTSKLEAGSAKAEAAFKQTADSAQKAGTNIKDGIGKGSDDAASQAAAAGMKIGAAFADVGKGMQLLKGAFTRIIIPLAIAEGIVHITQKIYEAAFAAEAFSARMSSIAVESAKSIQQASFAAGPDTLFKRQFDAAQKYNDMSNKVWEEGEKEKLRISTDTWASIVSIFAGTKGAIDEVVAATTERIASDKQRAVKLAGEAFVKQEIEQAKQVDKETEKILSEGLSEKERINVDYRNRIAEATLNETKALEAGKQEIANAYGAQALALEKARLQAQAQINARELESANKERRQAELGLLDERERIIAESEDKIAALREKISEKYWKDLDEKTRAAYMTAILEEGILLDKKLADHDKKKAEQRQREIEEEQKKQEEISKNELAAQKELQDKMREQARGYNFDNIVQSIEAMNRNLSNVIRTSAR